jgi:hypothetical protein
MPFLNSSTMLNFGLFSLFDYCNSLHPKMLRIFNALIVISVIFKLITVIIS